MKIIELESAIKKQSDRIAKSQIIPKCREVAKQLGEGRNTSEEWASASYQFSDDAVSIDYQVYAMGDEKLRVSSKEEKVFEVVERVDTLPNYSNPVVDIDRRRFEILFYKPGRWEEQIETIYHKMTTDVTEDELTDAQRRLGIVVYL